MIFKPFFSADEQHKILFLWCKVCYLTSVFEEMSSFKGKAPSVLETVVSHVSAKGMNI